MSLISPWLLGSDSSPLELGKTGSERLSDLLKATEVSDGDGSLRHVGLTRACHRPLTLGGIRSRRSFGAGELRPGPSCGGYWKLPSAFFSPSLPLCVFFSPFIGDSVSIISI